MQDKLFKSMFMETLLNAKLLISKMLLYSTTVCAIQTSQAPMSGMQKLLGDPQGSNKPIAPTNIDALP